ncbi:MAG: hypothetical protein R2851_18555 [Caldilineaceae bacterium]
MADEASWALIEALTPALADAPVLLALASRCDHTGCVTRMVDIKLGGLKGAEMAMLVAACWTAWLTRHGARPTAQPGQPHGSGRHRRCGGPVTWRGTRADSGR